MPTGSAESARRLFAMSQPISGTIVEAYLRKRGITALHGTGSLRFHPRCYYRPDAIRRPRLWPAMIAAVTDLERQDHRRASDLARPRTGRGKAPIDTPRRAMGHLLGNAVRFGVADDVMAAGEGIETMLSLRCVLPTMPMVAALSAAHLAAIQFPATLRRLYIARDDDPAGDGATATPDRPGDGGRDRGDRPVATSWGLQRRPPHARRRRAKGGVAAAARAERRRTLHGAWRHDAARKGNVRGGRRSRMAHSVVALPALSERPRPRPS